ncbi:MAG: PDZ domain-containing protein [Phycisphaerae bacterium]|nr:PDZ domain-containing protein [Phycisphaerae bacterium]
MRRILVAGLLSLILVLSGGCRSLNKDLVIRVLPKALARQSQGSWVASGKYVLTDSNLRKTTFEGTVETEDANVIYQFGLEEQARQIANQINDLTSHIEDSTGLKICYATRVYLLRQERIPENYEIRFESEPGIFTMPLFVSAGDESCQAIVLRNLGYPELLAHEIVEMSLIFHKPPGVVLPDFAGELLFLKPKMLNYTRWFREGFAEYVAVLAQQMLLSEQSDEYSNVNLVVLSSPFSSLSRVGEKLFKWHQYSSPVINNEYYDAALGLFLLIADRFGTDALKDIIAQMNELDYLDGPDLINAVNRALNTDVEELVANFHFPDIGCNLSPLTKATALNEDLNVKQGLYISAVEPNSLADIAGIKNKDVILKVDDEAVRNNLEFEQTLLKLLDRRTVDITIWRKDEGRMVIELPLKN